VLIKGDPRADLQADSKSQMVDVSLKLPISHFSLKSPSKSHSKSHSKSSDPVSIATKIRHHQKPPRRRLHPGKAHTPLLGIIIAFPVQDPDQDQVFLMSILGDTRTYKSPKEFLHNTSCQNLAPFSVPEFGALFSSRISIIR